MTDPLREAQDTDAIINEFRGKSVHGLAIRLADYARSLERNLEHWKRMYTCAQNANAHRQDALEGTAIQPAVPDC